MAWRIFTITRYYPHVVVHEGEHYVGGTEAGVQFLKDCGTYVPYSFLGYLSAKESGTYIIFVWY